MSTIVRAWLAFAAIGVGLIHLALVIGAPPAVGVVLAALGLAEFGWGVLTFARESVTAPRVALMAAIVPVLAWAPLLAVTSALGQRALPVLPLAIGTVLELFAAAVLGAHLRRTDAPAKAPGIARYLLGLAVGALAVAALTAPALAATQAGLYVVPPGDGSELFDVPVHGSH